MDINLTSSPDFALLAIIHKQCFDQGWNETAFAGMFSIKGTMAFVASDNSGFAVARILFEEMEIITLAVLPEHQKQGLGKKIVARMLAVAQDHQVKSIFLEVRESNIAAKKLYGTYGFEILSRRKDYYRRPDNSYEDAIIMRKDLR